MGQINELLDIMGHQGLRNSDPHFYNAVINRTQGEDAGSNRSTNEEEDLPELLSEMGSDADKIDSFISLLSRSEMNELIDEIGSDRLNALNPWFRRALDKKLRDPDNPAHAGETPRTSSSTSRPFRQPDAPPVIVRDNASVTYTGRGNHHYSGIEVRGNGRVIIGDTYGGKGFFNDSDNE